MNSFPMLVLLAALVVLGSEPAAAHDFDERYGAFLGNFLHAIIAPDHGLAFLTLGLLAGQAKLHGASQAVGSFLAGLLIGTTLSIALGRAIGATAPLTTVNTASVVALGGLVALAPRLRPWMLMLVAGALGASHGLDIGLDKVPESLGVRAILGVVLSGLLVSSLFAFVVATSRTAWQRLVVRVLGSWVAAIGLMMLGLHLR